MGNTEDGISPERTKLDLALAGAKTLRRDAGFLVQQLAQLRDELQPKEAQVHERTSSN